MTPQERDAAIMAADQARRDRESAEQARIDREQEASRERAAANEGEARAVLAELGPHLAAVVEDVVRLEHLLPENRVLAEIEAALKTAKLPLAVRRVLEALRIATTPAGPPVYEQRIPLFLG